MRRVRQFLPSRFLALAFVLPVLCATAAVSGSARAEADGLYRAFGEKAGLKKIADDFVAALLADARTEKFFAKTDLPRLREKLAEQFCELTGGPCTYSGRKMAEVHDGLEIKTANFNALVEDLQFAMRKNHVPERAQNKLLARLAPMHREIIEK